MFVARRSCPDSKAFELAVGVEGAKTYRRLLRAIGLARGRFHLFPVESSLSAPEREKMLSVMHGNLLTSGFCLRTIRLSVDCWDVLALIDQEPPTKENDVLLLIGLEDTPAIVREPGAEAIRPPALAILNQSRETLRALVHVPLIILCPPYAYSALIEHAPDLFDQYTGVFQFSTETPAKPDTVQMQGRGMGAASGLTTMALPYQEAPPLITSYAIELRRKSLADHFEPSPQRASALLNLSAVLSEQRGSARTAALVEALKYTEEALSLLTLKHDQEESVLVGRRSFAARTYSERTSRRGYHRKLLSRDCML